MDTVSEIGEATKIGTPAVNRFGNNWLLVITTTLALFFMVTTGFYYLKSTSVVTPIVNKENETTNISPIPTAAIDTGGLYTRIGNCDKNQCLFANSEAPEGFAYLTGYYIEYKTDDWGTPTTCSGLVVTGGNKTLIDHFNKWIDEGNGLNKRIDGNLVVNIPVEMKFENRIKESNKDKQIQLGVIRQTPKGIGVSICHPTIEVISVEEL